MQPVRLRRLREKTAIRDWVSETRLSPKNLILPYFVVEGKAVKGPIKSMPGVYHLSIDNLLKDIYEAKEIGAILLFGIPKFKDKAGSGAYKSNGVVQKAVRAVKKEYKDLVVITDVCLCGYTSHGHCGIVKSQATGRRSQVAGRRSQSFLAVQECINEGTVRNQSGENFIGGVWFLVDNDATLKVLSKIALSHAEAGADFVAPSAMMDGQVRAIREGLDKDGFKDVKMLAYSAKYASGFYGPFREALDSAPQFGDRKSYQMDYRNSDEALREIRQDIDEGADIIMIKPALAYLDIIYRAKQRFNIPVAAYSVSGEYAIVKRYCQDAEVEKRLAMEILTSIKRAGADWIITYWAKDIVKWLR